MNSKVLSNQAAWIAGLVLAGLTLVAFNTPAKKTNPSPPPPPLDTGIIYCSGGDGIYSMNPDGSGQQLVIPDGAMEIAPSRLLHSGQRWYVGWAAIDGVYPDGNARSELIAFNESGEVVPLADDSALEPCFFGSPDWTLHWLPTDNKVSWLAMRWDGETVVECGLYTLDLDLSSGVPTSIGQPTLLSWTANIFPIYENTSGYPYLLVDGYDWSPDGNTIVYSADGNLHVAGAEAGVPELLATNAISPCWSPDGSRIVFHLNDAPEIDMINADGTQRRLLVKVGSSPKIRPGSGAGVYGAVWSPASTHLVYVNWKASNWQRDTSLYRIAADGSGNTALPNTSGMEPVLGWRTTE